MGMGSPGIWLGLVAGHRQFIWYGPQPQAHIFALGPTKETPKTTGADRGHKGSTLPPHPVQNTAWVTVDTGYTGFPGLASAEAGAFFADLVIGRSIDIVRRGLAGAPEDDRPPMRWVGPLTGWGRIRA